MVTTACRRGDRLLCKGQRVSGAYLVVEGRLRVYTLAPDGTEATMYLIDPGETCVVAMNSLFNDLRYPAWVQAETDARVAIIPGPLFRQLFDSEPTVRDLTVRSLSTLVFRLMAELEEVHAWTLQQRLANLLLLRASTAGQINVTQQQLADHLGTTREVIARLMGELVDLGCVASRRGQVTVLDEARLAGLIAPLR